MKRVPDARALVSHAKTMKIVKMAEHRGYARAICELMNFDLVAPDHAKKLGDKSTKKQEEGDSCLPALSEGEMSQGGGVGRRTGAVAKCFSNWSLPDDLLDRIFQCLPTHDRCFPHNVHML